MGLMDLPVLQPPPPLEVEGQWKIYNPKMTAPPKSSLSPPGTPATNRGAIRETAQVVYSGYAVILGGKMNAASLGVDVDDLRSDADDASTPTPESADHCLGLVLTEVDFFLELKSYLKGSLWRQK